MNITKYTFQGHTFIVADGTLYVPAPQASPEVPMSEKVVTRRGRKAGSGKTPALTKIISHMRKTRRVLGPDAEEVVRQEILNGMGLTEVCKKYDISVGTFYRLKGELMNKPVIEETN